MSQINIYFDFAAFTIDLLLVFGIFWKKGKFRFLHNRLYSAMVINGLIGSTAEILFCDFLNNPSLNNVWVFYTFSYTFHVCHIFVPYLLAAYVTSLSGGDNTRKIKLLFTAGFIPVLACLVLYALNPFYNLVFTFSYDGTTLLYARQLGMDIIYVIGTGYGIYAIIMAFMNHKLIMPSSIVVYIVLIVIGLGAAFTQLFIRELRIDLFANSLIYMCFLLVTENEEASLNPVTRLYNRETYLRDIVSYKGGKTQFQTIIICMENYSYYSSTIGVEALHDVLRQIAHFLKSLNKNFICYDCSRGVFALIISHDEVMNMPKIADRIASRFKEPFYVEETSIYFMTAITAVEFPKDFSALSDIQMIINNKPDMSSDTQNVKLIFGEDLLDAKHEIKIRNALQYAIEHDSFEINYQPIYNTKEKKILSAEALVRLNDPKMGSISPGVFIPIAEKIGLINVISEIIFRKICQFLDMHRKDIELNNIDVNFSTIQCLQVRLAERYKNLAEQYNIPFSKIFLEVQQSDVFRVADFSHSNMQELYRGGMSFIMDNFGTGYSNFSDLFLWNFKAIKIDRSILWNADYSSRSQTVLNYTIKMLKELGYSVCIEGVETEDQKKKVEDCGVDFIQGFFFSQPLNGDDFIKYVNDYNSKSEIPSEPAKA